MNQEATRRYIPTKEVMLFNAKDLPVDTLTIVTSMALWWGNFKEPKEEYSLREAQVTKSQKVEAARTEV